MTKTDTKSKTIFNFNGVSIRYDLPNQADVYFLTDDNIYNKEINQLLLDWGYKRLGLHKSDPLVELRIGEYKWHGVYYRDDEMYQIENERMENIRKAPILLGNDI